MDLTAVSTCIAYVHLGGDGQAIANYDKALDINRKGTEAYFNCGYVYSHLGSVRQASEDWKAAARLAKKMPGPIENKPGIELQNNN
jgi:Tfp pilus assembly protein PilF